VRVSEYVCTRVFVFTYLLEGDVEYELRLKTGVRVQTCAEVIIQHTHMCTCVYVCMCTSVCVFLCVCDYDCSREYECASARV